MSYIYKASDFEGLSFNEMLDKVIGFVGSGELRAEWLVKGTNVKIIV